jgi:uncharacterized protein YebE (UPF0316 family)
MSNNSKDFKYTYSSAEQAEVRRIREKYSPKETREEDTLTRLRRLDAEVTNKASAVSLVFGVIGILILGLGMSLIMSDLSVMLGISHPLALTLGIISGLVGGALAALAYPVYNFITNRERKRIAPEILRLTDELMK